MTPLYDDVPMTPALWDSLANFSRPEFVCKCGCGRAEMHAAVMQSLQQLRTHVGRPFNITSGYRCPDHDARVSGRGAHVSGCAVDIQASGDLALAIMENARRFGFDRIGAAQFGPHAQRFIHLDQWSGGTSPAFWTYRG